MANIQNTFMYAASPNKVYKALTEEKQCKQWWTPDTILQAKVGNHARFEFNPYGDYCVMQITTLEPGTLVEWKCVEGKMMGTNEWIGTTLHFALQGDEKKTTLTFSHTGWKEETACFKECTQGWKHFLGESLKAYLETGQGKPFKPEN